MDVRALDHHTGEVHSAVIVISGNTPRFRLLQIITLQILKTNMK